MPGWERVLLQVKRRTANSAVRLLSQVDDVSKAMDPKWGQNMRGEISLHVDAHK